MPAALKALLAQLCALASITIIAAATAALPLAPAPGPLQWALMHGVIAAAIGHRLGLAAWWLPMHLAFAPALMAARSLDLPSLWFLVGFLVLVLVYGKVYQTGVPFYRSSRAAVTALLSVLPERQGFSFIDLGSGCGGLLHGLHSARPDGNYHGIEAAPLPFLLGQCRNLLAKKRYRTRWGNLWSVDLAPYDVAYAYLSPLPMAALWNKARKEMRPGSLFISNSFGVPGVMPQYSLELNDFGGSVLHLWRL